MNVRTLTRGSLACQAQPQNQDQEYSLKTRQRSPCEERTSVSSINRVSTPHYQQVGDASPGAAWRGPRRCKAAPCRAKSDEEQSGGVESSANRRAPRAPSARVALRAEPNSRPSLLRTLRAWDPPR